MLLSELSIEIWTISPKRMRRVDFAAVKTKSGIDAAQQSEVKLAEGSPSTRGP
jgi:hypothetical protein